MDFLQQDLRVLLGQEVIKDLSDHRLLVTKDLTDQEDLKDLKDLLQEEHKEILEQLELKVSKEHSLEEI